MKAALGGPRAPLPPVPVLTPGELAAVAGRRFDERSLLFDEFFWLWPRPGTKDGKDKALEAVARGAWLDAVEFWRVQCLQKGHDGLALHNIAVLFHTIALDLESLGEAAGTGGRQAKERDVWWKEAFRAWQSLRDCPEFWGQFADRLAGRVPGGAHVAFVQSVQVNLLAAVALVNGQLAAERRSSEEAWQRQVALIDATGYPDADLSPARQIAVEPIGRTIRAAISRAIHESQTDANLGLAAATRLLDIGRTWLPFFTRASLPAERGTLSDELAAAAMSCLDAYGSATGRWADLLPAANAALGVTQSPDTRDRLNKRIVIYRTNYSTQVQKHREEQLGSLRNHCSTILSAKAPGQLRLASLIQCARSDLRELVAAGAGDPGLETEATGTVSRALRELALDMQQSGESVLLTLDALAVAESLCRDAGVRMQVSAERNSTERGLRELQADEMSQVDGHYPLLMEHATPELYVGNAFRLTGLSVHATERELSRHIQKIEMAERLGTRTAAVPGPLGVSPPDVEATKAAVQRTQEVERRLLDEFFWLWPLPEHALEERRGQLPLPSSHEQLVDAIAAWKRAASQNLDHGLCAHNLAVLGHLQALDLELRQRTAPLSVAECATRDGLWVAAFAQWREALDTPTLWEELAERIESLADPRLDRAVMVRLRRGLPMAVLSTAVRLAVRAHDPAEVKRLVALVTSSGFQPGAVRKASTPLVDRIRETLSNHALEAQQMAKQTPTQADVISQGLLTHAWASLETLSLLLGPSDSVTAHSHDEVALAADECLEHFARETGDWPAVLKTLKQIEFLARGPSAKETIRGHLKIVSANALSDQASAQFEGLSKRLQAIVGAAASAEDRFAQMRVVMDSAPQLSEEPDYLVARSGLFAHWLQQLALRVNNDDEKYALALEIVELGLTFCKDPEILNKLIDARKTISSNADAAAIARQCSAIMSGGASNGEKLRELGKCANGQLRVFKSQHADQQKFIDVISDTVAGAIRSAAIDLCNNERSFQVALDWLLFAASLARGTDLRQRLAQDVIACRGLVDRLGAQLPPVPQKSSGCFIATAAYGSPLAKQVFWLRLYRDQILSRRVAGRAFIRAYNWASPPIAGWIAKRPLRRAGIRLLLLPVVAWCKVELWLMDRR